MAKYLRCRWTTRELGGPNLRLYPLACLHMGATQCDVRFVREQIARIEEDPGARWVYLGDGGECVTRLSKGDVFGQVLSPTQQQDALVDLLEPVKAQGLFGLLGNHGARVYKATGLDFDHTLCARLGLPYLGVAAMVTFEVNRSRYDAYFHHGIDSGITLRAKIQKAEEFARFIDADAIFTAHSHIAVEIHPAALLSVNRGARKIVTKLRRQYICGSAYDSRTGYAEAKGYPPLLPSWLSVEFAGTIRQGIPVHAQTCTVVRSDGTYPLEHTYVLDYLRATGE